MTDKIYTTEKEIDRARALWQKGVLLDERREGFRKMMLYQLHDIYVEVTMHTHFNTIMKVATFTDTERLAPYLKNISLENLLP